MAVVKGSKRKKSKSAEVRLKEASAVISVVARLLQAERGHRKKSQMWGLGNNRIFQGHRAELLWLYLRKNPEYCADYQMLYISRDKSGDEARNFCIRWGLVGQPLDPMIVELPNGYQFQRPEPWRIRYSNLLQGRWYHHELGRLKAIQKMGLAISEIARDFMVVPPMISEHLLLESFRKLNKDFLISRDIKEPIKIDNQKYLKDLVENAALNSALNENIMPKAINQIRAEKFKISGLLQSKQIKDRVATFNKIASITPWFFYSK